MVDESSWRFDEHSSETCIEVLHLLLDRVDDALNDGYGVCYSEELFFVAVWRDKSFYELYDQSAPFRLPREIQERMAITFSRLPKWQELDFPCPATFEVRVNGNPIMRAPSIAWAHTQGAQDATKTMAVITINNAEPKGSLDVATEGGTGPLWFVSNYPDYLAFFRWLIVRISRNVGEFEGFARAAFPKLDFVEGAFGGIKGMSKPYRELVSPIVQHLQALSDHGERVFKADWMRAPAEFGSLGVNLSDENGRTRGNATAKRERTMNFSGTTIVCWWHTKLGADRDRIYICPDRIPSGGRIIVGVFCRHLTT